MKDLFKKEKTTWKLITGNISKNIPYGFCIFKGHPGYLTKGLLEEHECMFKRCRYFIKNEEHPHWVRKEQLKALKKAKKEGKATYEFNGKTYLVEKKV